MVRLAGGHRGQAHWVWGEWGCSDGVGEPSPEQSGSSVVGNGEEDQTMRGLVLFRNFSFILDPGIFRWLLEGLPGACPLNWRGAQP